MKRRRWVRWAAAVGVGGCLGMGWGEGGGIAKNLHPITSFNDPMIRIDLLDSSAFKITTPRTTIINKTDGTSGIVKGKTVWSFNQQCFWLPKTYNLPILVNKTYFAVLCGKGNTSIQYDFFSISDGLLLAYIFGQPIYYDEKYIYFYSNPDNRNVIKISKLTLSPTHFTESETHLEISLNMVPLSCPTQSDGGYTGLLRFLSVRENTVIFRADIKSCDYQIEVDNNSGRTTYTGRRR